MRRLTPTGIVTGPLLVTTAVATLAAPYQSAIALV